MEHGILNRISAFWNTKPTRIPMTHCPNPALKESEAIAVVQFYSCSRPCRGLAADHLSHSGPGGCPDRVWVLVQSYK